MESLIKDCIVQHLNDNNLILPSQHGFMAKKSCTTNLLDFFEFVTKEIDTGNSVDAIYLDFSKAFDRVPFKRLLSKLQSHNVTGKIHNWISNWLHDRKQRVVINGKCSEWKNVISGVPQGSVLGPLAFVVFINDLDFAAMSINVINKFADDTKLGNVTNSIIDCEAMQTCLDNLCDWAAKWGMKFNEKKCKVIHFGRENPGFDYHMNNITLPVTHDETDVGVVIQNTLKPSKHCAQVARKANAILGTIARSFHFKDRFTFLNLYKTYVRCHLEYCSPAWSPYQQSDIDLLENVQRRAIGMISGLGSGSYEDKLKDLGLQSLEDRRWRSDMIQAFKIIHGVDNVDRNRWFKMVDTNPMATQTRFNSCPLNIVPSRSRLSLRSGFFSQRIVNGWNNLPVELKAARNIKVFKLMIDKHMISQ